MEIERIENMIKLDKTRIEFDLAQNKDKIEASILVKNNLNQKVAIRILTTRKELYNVVPTYTIIQPNSSIKIMFYLYKKDKLDDPSKHKFLLEAICFNESYSEKDVKKIFETLTIQKQRVQGINIRIFDPNKKEKEENKNKSEINDNNQGDKIRKTSLLSEEVPKQGDNNLERLNLDYFKLVNELTALMEENTDLKKKLQVEKTNNFISVKPNIGMELENIGSNVIEFSEEKQFSKFTVLFVFFLSFLLGFIMTI